MLKAGAIERSIALPDHVLVPSATRSHPPNEFPTMVSGGQGASRENEPDLADSGREGVMMPGLGSPPRRHFP